jgi:GntR family transcriptional regulator/MocR family aminotransferase
MPSRPTTSSVDLLVPDTGGGPRARVEDALRTAIGEGRLAPGARLPSTRALARDLGVARSTVVDAYAQLAAEGWIVGAQGSGTRVAATGHHPPVGTAAAAEPVAPRYDLRPGRPDVGAFPRAAWLGALRRALRDEPDAAFDYGDHRGHSRLRQEIAAYAGRVRGVRAHPDQIVVCAGFGQALAVGARALRATGAAALAMEDPCLAHHHTIAAASGMSIVTLPVDGDGAQVQRLAGLDAGGVLLTPAHQQPLGSSLSGARRGWVLEWARRTGATVLEDDYDSEFRFDRAPLGAIQGRAPDAVVHLGTVSKTLAPAVRLGWMVVPPRLVEAVVAEKAASGGQHGILDQLAFAELLRSGAYDRHVRRMRLRYRARRDHLLRRLAADVPEVTWSGIAAGLQTLVHLPAGGPSAAEVVAAAAERGLAVAAMDEWHWRYTGPAPETLVVGFGTPAEHAFHTTVDVLVGSIVAARGRKSGFRLRRAVVD